MKYLAPRFWPIGTRKGYCWLPPGSSHKCVMKEGFPFQVFWDELGVDFDEYIIYHMSTRVDDDYVKAEWHKRFVQCFLQFWNKCIYSNNLNF